MAKTTVVGAIGVLQSHSADALSRIDHLGINIDKADVEIRDAMNEWSNLIDKQNEAITEYRTFERLISELKDLGIE